MERHVFTWVHLIRLKGKQRRWYNSQRWYNFQNYKIYKIYCKLVIQWQPNFGAFWEGGGSNLKRQAQNFLSLKWNFHLSVFFPFKAAYPNDSQIVKLSKKWDSESVKSELFGGSRCPVSFSCLSTHTTLLLTSGHCFKHRLSFVSFLKISNRVGIVVGMFLG